jgi:hypothetical protein
MSEVDVPTENVYVKELRQSVPTGVFGPRLVYLADVFLLLVAVQSGIWRE